MCVLADKIDPLVSRTHGPPTDFACPQAAIALVSRPNGMQKMAKGSRNLSMARTVFWKV